MVEVAAPEWQYVHMPMPRLEDQRIGQGHLLLSQCPHCSVPNPVLPSAWSSGNYIPRHDRLGPPSRWAAYSCNSCGSVITAKGRPGAPEGNPPIVEIFPKPRTVDEELPDAAATFLRQAIATLHAPDAAAVMAGSAVDAMLKHYDYTEGSLYARIDKASDDGLLTEGMAEWAHKVRLGSNRPRHADNERPHVTPEEARQSVDFAEALGTFLFTLTARVRSGIEAADEQDA